MFFSTMCLYAMIWGATRIFGGLVVPLVPTAIKKVTKKVTKAAREVSVEDYKFTHGEGVFDHDVHLILLARYPFLEEYEMPELDEALGVSYWITKEEDAELKTLMLPLQSLQYSSESLDETFLHVQRKVSLRPVLQLLAKIPQLRRESIA